MLAFAVAGLAAGASFAMLGLALTITYRSTQTVNFAASGIGAFGAIVFADLSSHGMSYAPALVLGVAVSAALSILLGAVLVRWFSGSDVASRSVVTIAVLLGLIAASDLLFGGSPQPIPVRFIATVVTISGVPVAQSTVILLAIAVATAIGTRGLIRYTLVGKRLQAISERPATAELLGLAARRYGLVVWGVAGVFETVAIVLIASTAASDFPDLSFMVIPALAAALFGLFRSFAATLVAGVALGCLEGVLSGYQSVSSYNTIAPFIALLLILLVTQRGQRYEDAR